ncbi:MAG: hypothetical protein IRZ00_09315 [Gemmatimonadetes bacterium]|nr:hypothetical protein [Gemmatimonadota bacterium]
MVAGASLLGAAALALAVACFAAAVAVGSWPLWLGGYGLAAAALVVAVLVRG